jgi:Cytochrome C'
MPSAKNERVWHESYRDPIVAVVNVVRTIALTFCLAMWFPLAALGQSGEQQEGSNGSSSAPPQESAPQSQDPTSGKKPQTRKVTRAARPDFAKVPGSDLFFADVFAEALSGSRPDRKTPDLANDPIESGQPPVENGTEIEAATGSWSAIVPASALEDEVKRQQQELVRTLSNPVQFKTQNDKARRSFEILAAVFAIISEYDDQVRWKDKALSAVAACQSAGRLARTNETASFNGAKEAGDNLTELVRGGSFASTGDPATLEDWSELASRTTIMKYLEELLDGPLKTNLATEQDFSSELDAVLNDSAMVAAFGRVLQREAFEDADDGDYCSLSEEMTAAAQRLMDAAERGDYQAAPAALNTIRQSCDKCHEDWR